MLKVNLSIRSYNWYSTSKWPVWISPSTISLTKSSDWESRNLYRKWFHVERFVLRLPPLGALRDFHRIPCAREGEMGIQFACNPTFWTSTTLVHYARERNTEAVEYCVKQYSFSTFVSRKRFSARPDLYWMFIITNQTKGMNTSTWDATKPRLQDGRWVLDLKT